MAALVGLGTFAIQARGNGDSTASVTLRSHDQVVSWPNHSALQREAVATINSDSGQDQIKQAVGQPAELISVEASSLGDPASVEVIAKAGDDATALAGASAAAELAISTSIEDRAAPIKAQIDATSAALAIAVQERDSLLTQAAAGVEDDSQRAIVVASAEAAAGTASVLGSDLARLETELAARTAPLVAIDDPRLVSLGRTALNSALAASLGAFFVSLLGLSMLRQPDSEIDDADETIDLTDDGHRESPAVRQISRLGGPVE